MYISYHYIFCGDRNCFVFTLSVSMGIHNVRITDSAIESSRFKVISARNIDCKFY